MQVNTSVESISQLGNWKQELKDTATKYHVIGCWVAVVFNILFFITDYINVVEFWKMFLVFRVSVSLITFIAIFIREPLKIPSEYIVFIPVFLISIQNAFMWSYMDLEHLQKHTLAYIALFIGVGMLVLWKIHFSVVLVFISIIANLIFFHLNSNLNIEEVMVGGGLLTASVAIFSILLIQTRYNLTKKEIISRLALKFTNIELANQKEIIEEKNKNITDSIQYAKTIQDAVLPSLDFIKKHLTDVFVFFKPRDIVSGDFYWFGRLHKKSIIAAVDCTGHGVPGAFMSMIGNTLINEVILDLRITTPADILFQMRAGVIKALKQGGESRSKDGMDMSLCVIDHANQKLEYAGAYNPLIQIRNGELIEFKGDRMPIGEHHKRSDKLFTNHTVHYEPGDLFYLFTDGFADQFGGKNDTKFGGRRLRELLKMVSKKPINAQNQAFEQIFDQWKGNERQWDDVLIIGFRV